MANEPREPRAAQGPLDLAQWIATNAAAFRPPVANKVVFPGSELIFMVVRGPNARNDFHVNPGDEVFYQLEGTIAVDIRHDDGRIERRLVGAGEVMLVPAGVAHSPRATAATRGASSSSGNGNRKRSIRSFGSARTAATSCDERRSPCPTSRRNLRRSFTISTRTPALDDARVAGRCFRSRPNSRSDMSSEGC